MGLIYRSEHEKVGEKKGKGEKEEEKGRKKRKGRGMKLEVNPGVVVYEQLTENPVPIVKGV